MNDDCISRQAAIYACLNGWNKGFSEIMEDIKRLPSVEPGQKIGHWIKEYHPDGMPGCKIMWRCSDCDTPQSYGKTAYCPFCGKEKEGEDE